MSHRGHRDTPLSSHRPGDIRTLDRGKVLLIHRSLPPIRASTLDVSERPDWETTARGLRRDPRRNAPVDDLGYRLGAGHDQPPPQNR